MAPVGMDDFQQDALEENSIGETFSSAEARFAYERARRLRAVVKLAGAVVLLAVFAIFMYRLGADLAGGQAAADGHDHAPGEACNLGAAPIGSPDAKIQVTAIVPHGSDCHSGIVKFLQETAQARDSQIRAEFYTLEEYGEQKLASEIGEICAAVMVNGETEFKVIHEGEEHRISLIGTEPTHYTLGDIGEVLTQVYIKQYGDPGEPIYTVQEGHEMGRATGSGEGEDTEAAREGMLSEEELQLPGFKALDSEN